jgi:hypothetical protein
MITALSSFLLFNERFSCAGVIGGFPVGPLLEPEEGGELA